MQLQGLVEQSMPERPQWERQPAQAQQLALVVQGRAKQAGHWLELQERPEPIHHREPLPAPRQARPRSRQ